VLDVMNASKAHAHGITFKFTDSGASAMLSQIADIGNEDGEGGKKNWQFWVDTTYGDKSFAIYEVQAADVVLWRFAAGQGK
jgi:hypothetical protein